jgi:hypothetical protein
MKRILWIAGLSVALFMFTAFALLCATALILRNHYSLKAWTMLVFMSYGAHFLFICLQSAIRYGDPTAHLPTPEPPRTLYGYIDENRESR